MKDLKFTKEIKENWLAALRSGKYAQGRVQLRFEDQETGYKFCCLGVLADIHPDLDVSNDGKQCTTNEGCVGYRPFDGMLGADTVNELWQANDRKSDGKYTAVIPLIEAIPTEDEN